MLNQCCIFIIVVGIFGCTSKEKESSNIVRLAKNPTTIDIAKNPKYTIKDTDFIDIQSSISLDSTDDALLGDVLKVFEIKGEYYVVDAIYSNIKVFDNGGRINRYIGKIGEGPGEYTRLFDADFNELDSTMLIYSNDSRRLNEYNLDGTFIKQKNIPLFGYYFAIVPQEHSYYFYINYNSSELNQKHNLLVTDYDFNVLGRYFPYPKDEISAFSYSGKIIKNKEGVLLANALEDTVYQLSTTQYYPKYFFDFGSYACPIDIKNDTKKMRKILPEKAYLQSSFIEANGSLFFSYIMKSRFKKAVWLKEAKKLITSDNVGDKSILHIITIPCGIDSKGHYISFIKPEVLGAYMEDDPDFLSEIKVSFPRLHAQLIKLKDGNNPLLITFSVKQ